MALLRSPLLLKVIKECSKAEEGIRELSKIVDTLIIIPNQNLLGLVDRKVPISESFGFADSVLMQGVKGISDIITTSGLINVDFADVKAIMNQQGNSMMGMATANIDIGAEEIAEKVISNPLIEGGEINGTTGLLINITHANNISLHDLSEVTNMISSKADKNANVIVGFVPDDLLDNEVKITIIATGFSAGTLQQKSNQEAFQSKTLEYEDQESKNTSYLQAIESKVEAKKLENETFLNESTFVDEEQKNEF